MTPTLAEALRTAPSLETLDIEVNEPFPSAVTQHCLAILCRNPRLQEIRCHGTTFQPKIEEAIAHNPALSAAIAGRLRFVESEHDRAVCVPRS